MTAFERSGWRDARISKKHRDWGADVPGVDIDFLMLEYNLKIPQAVIDYKLGAARQCPSRNDANETALGSLYRATGDQLPFFVVRYFPEHEWSMKVYPMNDAADRKFGWATRQQTVTIDARGNPYVGMTELQFAGQFLHSQIRGHERWSRDVDPASFGRTPPPDEPIARSA